MTTSNIALGSKASSSPLKRCLLTGLAGALALTSAQTSFAAAKIDISENSFLTVGAGVRTQLNFADDGAPDGSSSFDADVPSVRLYFGGQLNDTVKFTVNTERVDGNIDILDAIVQLEFSDLFNVWAGLMLTPADRIELNGPYYGLTWNQYTQPLFASDQDNPNDDIEGQAGTLGRDTGITVWGSSGKFQYALGIFDGVEGGPNTSDNPLFAGRFAYNFLNKEQNPGYYTSSTYYGGLGNIFTVGVSFQSQEDGVGSATESGDFFGYTVDLLSETVLGSGDVLTIEAEYKEFDSDFDGQTPTTTPLDGCTFCLFDGNSYFATAAYLFKGPDGSKGDFQPYIRYVKNNPSDTSSSDLTEIGLNYIIQGHNARVNLNYSTGDANISGFQGADDIDLLTFGIQFQI